MSNRALKIVCMALAQKENSPENPKKAENNNEEKQNKEENFNKYSTDIIDLQNVPLMFLPDDAVLDDNNINNIAEILDSSQTYFEDCNVEDCLNINNNINLRPGGVTKKSFIFCDKHYPSNNIGCDEYDAVNSTCTSLMDQREILGHKKDEELKFLVPYTYNSSSEEETETHQPLKITNSSTQVSCDKVNITRNSLSVGNGVSRNNSFSDKEDKTYELPDRTLDNSDSNSESEIENEIDEALIDSENQINSARKRKLKSDKNEWKRNKNKMLRMEGKAYLGFTKKMGEKIKQNCPRGARSLKETCKSKKCIESKVRYCKEFTQECRTEIFNKFWNLSWDQRKIFVSAHVLKISTFKKTREDSRWKGTYIYHLNNGDENLQVCRTMFINTLDLGYKTVQYWVDQSSYGMVDGTSKGISTKEFVKKRYAENYKYLEQFFESLPKLPSHYCRRDTLKLYLEYSFHNMNELYGVYVNSFCKERGLTPLGRNVFTKTFKEKNLALSSPKKDQCNVCFSFKYGNITEEEYRMHIKRKEDARQAKMEDKIKSENGQAIVLTMDLQAVKLCPYLPANKIYFKTKLCCHNFTIFNLKSRDVMCYWFSENENNQLKASTFTTCVIHYLEENCVTPSRIPIIIYSDGCGYQNRNNVLANALLNFTIKNEIAIFQKYLEPGHTQMECDSVHSVIERKLRHREIHLPSDYASITTEARQTPKPYDVKLLDYTFFKDFSSSQYLRYSSIRPGRKISDPVINDIKCIKYEPNGTIEVKLDHTADFIQLPIRPKNMAPILNYPPLFNNPPKIKTEKWQHLQDLKSVLPKDTHYFYDNILHG